MDMMDTSLLPPTAVSAGRRNDELKNADLTPRIVVVHANDPYRTTLVEYLQTQGFIIDQFEDTQLAFDCIIGDSPVDTILIDADFPQMQGIGLFLRLMNLGVRTPIALFATEHDQTQEDKALENGAAEYFSKSRRFSIIAKRLRLLVDGARAKSTLAGTAADVISIGALDVRLRCHRASWKGQEVPLTVTEFKIVRLLSCRTGEEISYRDIYDMVHGTGFFAGEGPQGYRINVRSLIRKIRDRFRSIDEAFVEIENCPGIGYRWRLAPRDGCVDSVAEYMSVQAGQSRSSGEPPIWRDSMSSIAPQPKAEG
jgi:two-component system response regulator ChvI